MTDCRVLAPLVAAFIAALLVGSCGFNSTSPQEQEHKVEDEKKRESTNNASESSGSGATKKDSTNPESLALEEVIESVAKTDWKALQVMQRQGPPPSQWQVLVRSEWELVSSGQTSVPALLKALSHDSAQVRRLAARALGRTAGYPAVKSLSKALERETELPVRLSIVESLGLIGGEEATKSLRGVLGLKASPGGFWDVKREVDESLRYTGKVDRERLLREYKRASGNLVNAVTVGKTVPDLVVLDSSGREFRLSDLWSQANLVLVFVFAEFCMYCNGQIQDFRSQIGQISRVGGELAFVVPQVPERVEVWKTKSRSGVTFVSDPAARLQALFGVANQIHLHEQWFPSPSCAIVDRKGVLRYFRRGRSYNDRISSQQVLKELDRLQ